MISILIPVYNASEYLEATLQSVAEQIYDDEIILVDDGSTDNSIEIAFKFLSKSGLNYNILDNPGKGACAARNHAFRNSTGSLIQWLDADDILGSDHLVKAKQFVHQSPNLLHAVRWHPFRGDVGKGTMPDNVDWTTIPMNSTPAEWIARDTHMGHHCYLGHRSLYKAAGLWDESLSINQDGEYYARVIAQSQGVHFNHDSKVFYRRNSNDSISHFTPEKADSLFHSTELMAKTALQLEVSKSMKQMVSNRWQRFIYTAYPHSPELISAAQKKLKSLPKPTIDNPNAVSGISKVFSKTFGWRALTQARMIRSRLTS